MNILVDIDDVLADHRPEWLRRYNEATGDTLKDEQVLSWEIHNYARAGMEIYAFLEDLDLYDCIVPVLGAWEGIQELRKAGHHILFVTSSNATHMRSKLEWLENRGFLLPDGLHPNKDFIVAHRKDMIRGDVIIDDREKNVADFPGMGILFGAPHNARAVFLSNFKRRAMNWGEVVRIVEEMKQEKFREANKPQLIEGVKNDLEKDPWNLLPYDALREVVKVFGYGAGKYNDHNWAKGMDYSRCYAAALRHLTAWWDGEEMDLESGFSHLAHASCNILFLLAYQVRNMTQFDNRPFMTGAYWHGEDDQSVSRQPVE